MESHFIKYSKLLRKVCFGIQYMYANGRHFEHVKGSCLVSAVTLILRNRE